MERTFDERKQLFLLLRHLKAFSTLSDFLLLELCGVLHLDEFESKRVVFNQGDRASSWFVILQGEVDVIVRRENEVDDDLSGSQVVKVASLVTGDGFGEVALINDSPRMASIYTRTECFLLRVEKADYVRILRFVHHKDHKDKVLFLSEAHLTRELPPSSHDAIANILSFVSYPAGTTIIQSGGQLDKLYIMRSGTCDVFGELVIGNNDRQDIENEWNEIRGPVAGERTWEWHHLYQANAENLEFSARPAPRYGSQRSNSKDCRLTDVPLASNASSTTSVPHLSSNEEDDTQCIPLMIVAYSMGSSIATEFLSEYKHYVDWKERAGMSRVSCAYAGVDPTVRSSTTAEDNADTPHFRRWEERLGVAGMKLLRNCKVYITMGSPCGWQNLLNGSISSDVLASPLANVYEESHVKDVELPFLPRSIVKQFGMSTTGAPVPGNQAEELVRPVMTTWASTIQELTNVIFWLDMMATPLKWTPISHAIYPVDEGVYELVGRKVGSMVLDWEKATAAISAARKDERKRKRHLSKMSRKRTSTDSFSTTSQPQTHTTGNLSKRPNVVPNLSKVGETVSEFPVSAQTPSNVIGSSAAAQFGPSYLNLFNFLPNPLYFPTGSHTPYPFHLDLRPLTPSFTGPSADKDNLVFLFLPGMVTGPDYEDEIASAVKGFSSVVRRISLQQKRKVEAMLAVVDYTSIGDASRHARWEGFVSRDIGGWRWDPEEGMVWIAGTGEEGIIADKAPASTDSRAKSVVSAAVGAALTVQEIIKGGLGVGRWRRWWRWMGLRKIILEKFAFVVRCGWTHRLVMEICLTADLYYLIDSALTEAPVQYSIIEGTRNALATLTETLRQMGYTSKKPANLIIVGHSIGGFFAQMMLNRHREVFENVRAEKWSNLPGSQRRKSGHLAEGLSAEESDILTSDLDSDSGLSTAESGYSVSTGIFPLSPRRIGDQVTIDTTGTGSVPVVPSAGHGLSPLTFKTIITLGSYLSWVADPAEILIPEGMKNKWVSIFFTEDFFSGPLSPLGLRNVSEGLAAEIGIGLFEARRSIKASRSKSELDYRGALRGVGTGISGAVHKMLHKLVGNTSCAGANARRRHRTRSDGLRKRHKRAKSKETSVKMSPLVPGGSHLSPSTETGMPSSHRSRGYMLVDSYGEVVSSSAEVDEDDDELGYGYDNVEGKRRISAQASKVPSSTSGFHKVINATADALSTAAQIPLSVHERMWDVLEGWNEEYGLDRWTGFVRRVTGPLGEGYVNDPIVWRIMEGVVGGILKDGNVDPTSTGVFHLLQRENKARSMDQTLFGTSTSSGITSSRSRRLQETSSIFQNESSGELNVAEARGWADKLMNLALDIVTPVSASSQWSQ
ncbi:hypothetical protein HDU93_008939 [Gonapodya sp. JEL0774]|nr:hypothetical protein HDU93_008939 [Gonapodya sp. JEL0774]